MLAEIDGQFPGHEFSAMFRRAVIQIPEPIWGRSFFSWYEHFEKDSATGRLALEECLRMESTNRRFEQLTAGACDPNMPKDAFGQRPFFKPGSHMKILHWKPAPWHIPTLPELDLMESLLRESEDLDAYMIGKHWDPWQWRFSACAVAIHTLQRPPSKTRANLRHIVLHEVTVEVSLPWSHAQGIVAFLKENQQLQVERWIRSYLCAFLSRWDHTWPEDAVGPSTYEGKYHFASMISWLEEAHQMSLHNAPKKSSHITIFKEDGGDSGIFTLLHKGVQTKHAALDYLKQHELPRTPTVPGPIDRNYAFQDPWALPDWLDGLVDDLDGDSSSLIRYEGEFAREPLEDIVEDPHVISDEPLPDWQVHWYRLQHRPVWLEHIYSVRRKLWCRRPAWEQELLQTEWA